MTDPVENIVAKALEMEGIVSRRDVQSPNGVNTIDFYLPYHDLWIEACQFHSPRKIKQMDRLPNVILVQGMLAAVLFSSMAAGLKL